MASSAATKPLAILQSGSGIFDLCFADQQTLVTGSVEGDLAIWNLEDRRTTTSWSASQLSLLSVASLADNSQIFSQAKDGRISIWDASRQAELWHAETSSCSFARALPLASSSVPSSLDEATEASTFWQRNGICSPLAEPSEVGVFDTRSREGRPQVVLRVSQSALRLKATKEATGTESSLGMCTSLCRISALGPSYILSVFESTDVCAWDLRRPEAPISHTTSSSVADTSSGSASRTTSEAPAAPALSAVAVWRHVWVASADGSINILKFRSSGQLQRRNSVEAAAAAAVPYAGEASTEGWQREKCGLNLLVARPDLRLVAAARWDRRVELFDTKTAQSLGRLQSHDGGVLGCAFDRHSGVLATSGEDGRIALWNALVDTYHGPVTYPSASSLPT